MARSVVGRSGPKRGLKTLSDRVGTRTLAVAFALAAFGSWALWYWLPKKPPGFLSSWMPNLGTSLILVTLSLLVVDRVVDLQRKKRKRKLVVGTLTQIGVGLEEFAMAAGVDYVRTHLLNYRRPADTVSGLISDWRDGLQTVDHLRAENRIPAVIDSAVTLGRRLDELDLRYAEELDDQDLSESMRQFVRIAKAASVMAQRFREWSSQEIESPAAAHIISEPEPIVWLWTTGLAAESTVHLDTSTSINRPMRDPQLAIFESGRDPYDPNLAEAVAGLAELYAERAKQIELRSANAIAQTADGRDASDALHRLVVANEIENILFSTGNENDERFNALLVELQFCVNKSDSIDAQVRWLPLVAAAHLAAGNRGQASDTLAAIVDIPGVPESSGYLSQLPGMMRVALKLGDARLAERLYDRSTGRHVSPWLLQAAEAILSEVKGREASTRAPQCGCQGPETYVTPHSKKGERYFQEAAARYEEVAQQIGRGRRSFETESERAHALLGQARCLLALDQPCAEPLLVLARSWFRTTRDRRTLEEAETLLEQCNPDVVRRAERKLGDYEIVE